MDAAVLTAFLSPVLPFLLKVGGKAADGAIEQFGADVWNKAKKVWGKLMPKIESKATAKEAAEDLAKAPDDEQIRTILQWQLKKILEEDKNLAAEIAQLMKDDKNNSANVTNIKLEGKNQQKAGDHSKQIGQIGSAGDISL